MYYQPVLLITDLLLYLLLGGIALFAAWSRRHEHLRAPWRYVLQNRLALISLVILGAYWGIGILDSIHFRATAVSTNTVKSLLDIMVAPLGEQIEKTYSAPFATHLYTKEVIEKADGGVMRDYPRLSYGGSHLANLDQDSFSDILYRGFFGIGKAVVVVGILFVVISVCLTKRYKKTYRQTLRIILGNHSAVPWRVIFISLSILALLICLAINLAPYYHIFGTDKVGHDVFYQSLKSVRTGLLIGTLTTLVMLPFAIIFGAMAGYFQGWVDDVIQYLYITLSSVPGVLLIAASVLSLQIFIANHPDLFATADFRADIRLLALCTILGVTSWTTLCRLLRGETLKLREIDYVNAARAMGASNARIILHHIAPNFMHIVLITVVLDFSGLVLAEAVLSYLGVGVDPETYSWGNMINAARLEMAREPIVWWPLLSAFVFMFSLVLAANLFADVVRDAFDPRVKKTEKSEW